MENTPSAPTTVRYGPYVDDDDDDEYRKNSPSVDFSIRSILTDEIRLFTRTCWRRHSMTLFLVSLILYTTLLLCNLTNFLCSPSFGHIDTNDGTLNSPPQTCTYGIERESNITNGMVC